MKTDSITWGETYDIEVSVNDENGDPITLDGTYQAACRIAKTIGGAAIAEPPMTIADGKATATIDTGDAEYTARTYYYDVRITDPDGADYWSEPVKLTLVNRTTPASS